MIKLHSLSLKLTTADPQSIVLLMCILHYVIGALGGVCGVHIDLQCQPWLLALSIPNILSPSLTSEQNHPDYPLTCMKVRGKSDGDSRDILRRTKAGQERKKERPYFRENSLQPLVYKIFRLTHVP